ncbi:unnamed protein product [Adineta steineri]|uniref:Hydrophobin n=1 Tax=Adineta steineri TaxID=433720 RepID=A0A815L1G7_9BILA|nr:unnamed protein product [Adineta steineri]CAF3547254.1 unnamed protein product [Adineta steineri]
MEMSKCLCVMIVAVIVVAASASPIKKRSSNGESSNGGQQYNNRGSYGNPSNGYQQNYYVNKNQNSVTNTDNECNTAGSYCCNNQAIKNNANGNGRRKRNSSSGSSAWGPTRYFQNQDNSQQYACNQYNPKTSGDQTTGCSTGQTCCQGNNQTGVVTLSCSNVNLGDLSQILDLTDLVSSLLPNSN